MKKYIFVISLLSLILAVGAGAVAPNSVSDLHCQFSDEPGALYLSWTPSTSTVSYNVRFFDSPINENNFNNVYQFNQTWSGSTNSGLIYNLRLDTYWYLAMKGQNAAGEISGISNVISCYVSTSTELFSETLISQNQPSPTSTQSFTPATSTPVENQDNIEELKAQITQLQQQVILLLQQILQILQRQLGIS